VAAYILCPTDDEWEVLIEFVDRLREGAIVVTPECQKALLKAHPDLELPDSFERVAYDFGGQPDIMIDMCRRVTEFPVATVLKAMKEQT